MFLNISLFSLFDVSWVRIDCDIFNGVKQEEVFCLVAYKNRQKQGKNVEKKDMFTFFVLSPLILHIINENTALLKEKEISFSPVCK